MITANSYFALDKNSNAIMESLNELSSETRTICSQRIKRKHVKELNAIDE